MVAVVANRGRLVTPTLVKAVYPPGRSQPVPEPPGVISRVPIKKEYLELIHQGMVAVVNEPHGTAPKAKLPGITVAGKTGTAQVVSLKFEKSFGKKSAGALEIPLPRPFCVLRPGRNPTIALAVVVEHGGRRGQ